MVYNSMLEPVTKRNVKKLFEKRKVLTQQAATPDIIINKSDKMPSLPSMALLYPTDNLDNDILKTIFPDLEEGTTLQLFEAMYKNNLTNMMLTWMAAKTSDRLIKTEKSVSKQLSTLSWSAFY